MCVTTDTLKNPMCMQLLLTELHTRQTYPTVKLLLVMVVFSLCYVHSVQTLVLMSNL